jgi:beta-lactamase class A
MIEKIIDDALASMEGEFSVILKDLAKDRTCYVKDAARQIPSASTIKILIMIEAYRRMLLGNLQLEDRVKIKTEDKVEFSIITHMSTDMYTVRDLILLMMSISDNTATNVLIDLLGMQSINDTGEVLGLKGTVLQRKMMDFEAASLGRQNYTTPKDMVMLLDMLYQSKILTPEVCKEMLSIMSTVVCRDFMLRELPAETRVAHKTGELEGINHDIGIIYTKHCDYILGIFVTGLKDNIHGRRYIAQLSKVVFDHINRIGGIE